MTTDKDTLIQKQQQLIQDYKDLFAMLKDREAKAAFLNELRSKYRPSQTIAVGDGANDIEMVKAADIGIAFCAKPALQAVADVVITNRDLREVLANL